MSTGWAASHLVRVDELQESQEDDMPMIRNRNAPSLRNRLFHGSVEHALQGLAARANYTPFEFFRGDAAAWLKGLSQSQAREETEPHHIRRFREAPTFVKTRTRENQSRKYRRRRQKPPLT